MDAEERRRRRGMEPRRVTTVEGEVAVPGGGEIGEEEEDLCGELWVNVDDRVAARAAASAGSAASWPAVRERSGGYQGSTPGRKRNRRAKRTKERLEEELRLAAEAAARMARHAIQLEVLEVLLK